MPFVMQPEIETKTERLEDNDRERGRDSSRYETLIKGARHGWIALR